VNAAVHDAVVRTAREDSGRVIALLARRYGDLDVADEAVQDALVDAGHRWPIDGVPTSPIAWLTTVANRKAIDAIRRADSRDRRLRAIAGDLLRRQDGESGDGDGLEAMMVPDDRIDDAQLRLIFLCCHPALDQQSQVALTLRLVGGLTTAEIAAAFMVPEATLAQRIVRAKRKIRDARIPMSVPADLDDRTAAVLSVLYLVFNEGYLSRSATTDGLLRIDLANEAIRVTEALAELLPDRPEVTGLLALQLFQHARAAARTDATGSLVLLDDQDRSTWDRAAIARANALLAASMRRMQPGPFQMQALIASHHANAPTAADTDWLAIASAYRQLAAMTGSPVVALNHAVALAMTDGPAVALAALERIDGLDGYHLFHTTRAELLDRLGRFPEATDADVRALELIGNASERRFVERRIAARPPDAAHG
jgi:RNA polymerase sigma-70 factor (ECF subfamily)